MNLIADVECTEKTLFIGNINQDSDEVSLSRFINALLTVKKDRHIYEAINKIDLFENKLCAVLQLKEKTDLDVLLQCNGQSYRGSSLVLRRYADVKSFLTDWTVDVNAERMRNPTKRLADEQLQAEGKRDCNAEFIEGMDSKLTTILEILTDKSTEGSLGSTALIANDNEEEMITSNDSNKINIPSNFLQGNSGVKNINIISEIRNNKFQ